MKRAPRVEMTELKSNFAVVISEVGALTSYRQMNRLRPRLAACGAFLFSSGGTCKQFVHKLQWFWLPHHCGEWSQLCQCLANHGFLVLVSQVRWQKISSRCCSTCPPWWGAKIQEILLFHRQWSLWQNLQWGSWHALLPEVATAEAHSLLHNNLARSYLVGFRTLC